MKTHILVGEQGVKDFRNEDWESLEEKFYDLYNQVKTELFLFKPFDLRELLKEDYLDQDEDDILFDLPYAQTTDNNGYYRIPLAVVGKDEDNYFICIGTGEEFGDKFILSADEIPTESLFALHTLINEIAP
jgi:hypothetical protein